MIAARWRDAAPARRALWRRALIGLFLGAACAAVANTCLHVSYRDVLTQLTIIDVRPFAVAAAAALVLLGLQSLRWWIVMRPVLPLGYGQAYRALMVGFFFNALLMARAGDLLRVQYLGRRSGVSRATLVGTEIVDFCSDKWGWAVAFAVLCLREVPPAWLPRALLPITAATLAAGILMAGLASPRWRRDAEGNRGGPRWLEDLRRGFAASRWRRLLIVETVVAPLPWLWEAAVIALTTAATGFPLTLIQAFAVLTAFNVIAIVPAPGNAGSFEAAGTVALVALGVAQERALAFMVFYHLSQLLPGFLGGLALVVHDRQTLLPRVTAPREPVAPR